MPRSSTIRIGPILLRAINPKLSFALSLSLRDEDKPIPRAIINGTVIGPVVTPPESKATARNSLGVARATRNRTTYISVRRRDRLTLNKILSTAATRKHPTPIATVSTST